MVERHLHALGKGGHEEALGIALDQDDAAGKEQFGTCDIQVPRQIVDIVFAEADPGGRAADGAVGLGVLEQEDRSQGRDAGDMGRVRREQDGEVVALPSQALEKVAVDGPLQVRMEMRFRFLDREEAVVALVVGNKFFELERFERKENEVGRAEAGFCDPSLPPSVRRRMLR